MKVIKPSIQYLGKVPTDLTGNLKFIEKCGRLCYKSEDKITEDSALPFVGRLIKNKHLAMVEHSNFVILKDLSKPLSMRDSLSTIAVKYLTALSNNDVMYVGGNLTAWYQACINDLDSSVFIPFIRQYGSLFGIDHNYPKVCDIWRACEFEEIPKELHRHSVKFICDRGVSHELVRHRPCSFAQESTRYVNYGGKDVEFVEPTDFELWSKDAKEIFFESCHEAEANYQDLLDEGLKPQAARAALTNSLKTEIIVTADVAEWKHIKSLRTAAAAHPDMRRVMDMVPWEEIVC